MASLLAQPGQIGRLQLKNRIIMGPMGSNFGTSDGLPTERDKLYYAERARGGVAMIVTEAMAMSEKSRNHDHSMGVFHDRFIPGLARLVEAIHSNGALAVAQIGHRGGLLRRSVLNMEPVGPSPWVNPNTGDPVRELTVDEIREIQRDFLAATLRLSHAGYDGVQIHAANGYLLHQFFSRRVNKRTDGYGGSLENRMRFLLETIGLIRRRLPDLPLLVRLSATEYEGDGYTQEEVIRLAQALEQEGISALDLSGGSNESPRLSRYCIQPPSMSRRCLEPYAAPIKRAVSIPVAMAGRIIEPADAEALLANGSTDFVVLARALRADAYWVRKATGEVKTPIRQCISCNVCFERLTREMDVSCTQNPLVGTEFESLELCEPQAAQSAANAGHPSSNGKRVLVLGAGVAGVEAARLLAATGNTVEIWEKAAEAGGQSRLAAVPPHKQEIRSVWSYRYQQIQELGVPLHVGVAVTADEVRRFAPDVVVVATGAQPHVPDLFRSLAVPTMTAWDLLAEPERVPRGSSVTIVGGGTVGLETAELLAERCCRVTVLEMLPSVAPDMPRNNRTDVLLRLEEKGVALVTEARVEGIDGDTLTTSVKGERREIPIGDFLVLALGVQPNRDSVPVLEEATVPYILVGDCNRPGDFRTAIRDASLTALSINSRPTIAPNARD